MPNERRASELRQEIGRLSSERAAVERELLRRRRMLAASLVERHLGTRQSKRESSAFYLSWARAGRTRLLYVAKGRLAGVRQGVEAWRAFRAALRRWRELSERLEALWRDLGEAQAQSPEELPS